MSLYYNKGTQTIYTRAYNKTPVKRIKKSIHSINDPTTEQLLFNMRRIPREDVRAYLSLIYLTGNRVSEILGIRRQKIVGFYEYNKPTKKNPTRIIKVAKLKTASKNECKANNWPLYEVEPIRKWDIQISEEKPVIRLVNVHTLKIKGRPTHTYIARVDGEEKDFYELFKEYYDKKRMEEYLFKFTRRTAHRYSDNYLNIPPHKLRGLRATRDAVKYNLDSIDLQTKFNWKSPTMPLFYARKNTRELENKLLK